MAATWTTSVVWAQPSDFVIHIKPCTVSILLPETKSLVDEWLAVRNQTADTTWF